MANVVVQNGLVCVTDGAVLLDCGCVTAPCCERDAQGNGGSTMYLPDGEEFAGTVGLSGSVSAIWRSPSEGTGAIILDDRPIGGDEILLRLFEESYAISLAGTPIEGVINSLLANGCVSGFEYDQRFQVPGHNNEFGLPSPVVAGSYAAGYEVEPDSPYNVDALLYLRRATITALHPEFPVDPATVVPWSLTLLFASALFDYNTGESPAGGSDVLAGYLTLTVQFGTPCSVNAPEFSQVVLGPDGVLDFDDTIIGGSLLVRTGFDEFFAFVSPSTGGPESLSWTIGLAGTEQGATTVSNRNPAHTQQVTASAALDASISLTYGPAALTAFGVCPDYQTAIDACNPTGAEACCTAWPCGKVNPAQPFRWTRRQSLGAAIFDLDPNNPGANTWPGWSAFNTIDDIANMTAGTPDCGISSTTAQSAFGGSFAPDRLGQSRVLVMQGTTLPEGLGFWANRVLVEPIVSDIARRWRATIEAVVRWDRAGAGGGSLTTLGTMRIIAETPVLGSPPIGDQAPMNIITAFFRWTNLPLQPVGGEGFALDAAVNPDPQDDLDVEAFATYLPDSLCLSTIQVYGASGLLVDTQRFGWLTDSTNLPTPQTRRLIRIRLDSPITFGLLNVGVCPPPGVAQSPQQGGCVGCGDGGLR